MRVRYAELFGMRDKTASQVGARPGAFQEADGGTVFLDEFADTPMEQQGKYLRVLQDRLVKPVGAEREKYVDVFVVGASNKDVPTLVKAGNFRFDLWSRLSRPSVTLPPLRSRPTPIPRHACHING
jgi:transcriptional regulator with GAF, ATPase, and Fis domain